MIIEEEESIDGLGDGWWWVATRGASYAMKVVDGVIMEGPPYIKRWALGRFFSDVIDELKLGGRLCGLVKMRDD